MTALTAERFSDFFSELHRHTPFPWQARFAAQALADDWPTLVKLPTASGKTALIDVWVYALAAQAGRPPSARTAPRRMAFVVDRRVIVDDAFARAKKIAEALDKAQDGILREVADALRGLAGADSATPLQCFQLRGGMYRDDEWARTPTQPTLLTSTVDQIGSRLLFRSFGFVKGFTYPIHAGLAAFDMLIVLDEAHCSQPFYQTARAIERYHKWAKMTPPGPFHFITMTATPLDNKEKPFELESDDFAHPELAKRLNASKPTRLLTPVGNAKDEESQFRAALVEALVTQAEASADKGLKVIGVMVNRVATARAVHAALEAKGRAPLLLIGGMRPFDRDIVQHGNEFQRLMADKSEKRKLDAPVFVVATQTLEVGANLDFDGLVSECASLDAVRQRFGRLNRMGRENIRAEGVLVIRADDADIKAREKKPDPVYSLAMAKTWDWLKTLPAVETQPAKAKGKGKSKAKKPTSAEVVNFGITALQPHIDALDKETRDSLSQNALDAPVMLPAHIDAWAQTSPAPVPEPDVSIFLHGPQRGRPEVQLVWRADLDTQSRNLWIDTVALCPPTSVEALAAPLYLVKRWLRDQRTQDNGELADVEGIRLETDRNADGHGRAVLLWRGPKREKKANGRQFAEKKESQVTTDLGEILPGDTLVLPVAYGGWEIFGHLLNPDMPDIAEAARFKARRQLVFRLHPDLLAYLPSGPAHSTLREAANAEDKPDLAELKEAFAELAQSAPEQLQKLFAALATAKLKAEEYPANDDKPAAGWVITGSTPNAEPDQRTDEDDSPSLSEPHSKRVLLADHVQGVTDFAVRYATQCGLPDELVNDFQLAGQFHDAGKADPRFQAWLYGCMGRPYLRERDELLGKSTPISKARTWEAQTESGYPKGSRHELLSVSLIQKNESLKAQAHDWDLVLHLIASHHGRCRPFAPVVPDPEPEQVTVELSGQTLIGTTRTELERLDSGVAERFWALTRKYGWWGLAYLEAIFRLADHRQSQKDTGR